MPDLDQIKQVEQEARKRCRRWPNRNSAIPSASRAAAATTSTAARLLLAAECEGLTRKALSMASDSAA